MKVGRHAGHYIYPPFSPVMNEIRNNIFFCDDRSLNVLDNKGQALNEPVMFMKISNLNSFPLILLKMNDLTRKSESAHPQEARLLGYFVRKSGCEHAIYRSTRTHSLYRKALAYELAA